MGSTSSRKSDNRSGVFVSRDSVTVAINGQRECIRTSTVIWAGGVTAAPFGKTLAHRTGASIDREGRIPARLDLTFNRGARLITGTAPTDFNFNKEIGAPKRVPVGRIDGVTA